MYVAFVVSLMQYKIFVINCVLFHVKREHSHDCKSMMVLQSHMDLLKVEPGSCEETCLMSSGDGNKFLFIKVENVTDIKEDDDPEPVTAPVIKTEHEVSCICVRCSQPLGYTRLFYASLL
jgi:hypothetical protein